jgi:trehalose-phosphatase
VVASTTTARSRPSSSGPPTRSPLPGAVEALRRPGAARAHPRAGHRAPGRRRRRARRDWPTCPASSCWGSTARSAGPTARSRAPEPLPGVEVLRRELPALLAAEGAELEDKGLALVVHTRPSPDPAGALERLRGPLSERAEAAGLEVHPGRLVLELRPPGYDKRGALLSLCEPRPSAVLFAGDDLGDLPAFDAVDELRAQGVAGVLVCSASDEGPPALRERADLVVDGPAGVVALLRSLLA